MKLQNNYQHVQTQRPVLKQEQAQVEVKADRFQASEHQGLISFAGSVVGAGLGIAAGLSTGGWASLGGTLGGAGLGGVCGGAAAALVSGFISHNESDAIVAALWAGAVGAASCGIAGGILAYSTASIGQAVALGVGGAIVGGAAANRLCKH